MKTITPEAILETTADSILEQLEAQLTDPSELNDVIAAQADRSQAYANPGSVQYFDNPGQVCFVMPGFGEFGEVPK